jgi:hypothetical protein
VGVTAIQSSLSDVSYKPSPSLSRPSFDGSPENSSSRSALHGSRLTSGSRWVLRVELYQGGMVSSVAGVNFVGSASL